MQPTKHEQVKKEQPKAPYNPADAKKPAGTTQTGSCSTGGDKGKKGSCS
jgi:hypothetical protein